MKRRVRQAGYPNPLPLDERGHAPARRVRDAVFFATLPDRETALRLVAVGRALRRRYALGGPLLPAMRLHVTVLGFDVSCVGLEACVESARRIGATVRRAPFPVILEGAMSFGGGGNRAQVLRCSQGSEAALTGLYDRLRDVTDHLGLSRLGIRERFVPHLTLAYDHRAIPETALEAPIGWLANELVLIRSEQGLGRYTRIDRWPFRPS